MERGTMRRVSARLGTFLIDGLGRTPRRRTLTYALVAVVMLTTLIAFTGYAYHTLWSGRPQISSQPSQQETGVITGETVANSSEHDDAANTLAVPVDQLDITGLVAVAYRVVDNDCGICGIVTIFVAVSAALWESLMSIQVPM